MTIDQTMPFSDADLRAVSAKLTAWAQTLPPSEQRCLAALLMPPDQLAAGEVEGFVPSRQLMEILSNVSKTRSEISMTFARNLRG